MSKVFPPPPFQSSRKESPSESPFGPPTPIEEEDPAIKDDDVRFIFKQFLIPDHLSNEKILRFILHYCTHRNSTQAAKAVGLTNGGYWRSRPDVHNCIEALTQRMVIKHGYDSHEIIERTKEIVNIDVIDFQNPDGTFKTHLSEVRPEARRAIKKFKAKNIFSNDENGMRVVTGQLLEVELWDKMKGLEMLGSEKNIFKKTTVVQHDVTNNMKDVLLESGNRAEERLRLMSAREVGDDVQGETKTSGGREGWTDDRVSIGESSSKSSRNGSGDSE